LQYTVFARMELPHHARQAHVNKPVVVHSSKWKRAQASDSTFVSYVDLEVRCSRGTRSVLGFGSVRAILEVQLEGSAKVMVLLERWAVNSKDDTFGEGKANDIVAAGFDLCAPIRRAGGLQLVHARHILSRVVFLRSATNHFKGHVVPEWVSAPFRNPSD
jgi:hypothetical protein